MKRISLFLLSLLFSLPSFSQGLFDTLTDKYASVDGFSATNLTRDMFDLYIKKKQLEANSPVYETLKKLDNILVISATNPAPRAEPAKMPGNMGEIHTIILDYYKKQSFTLFKTENRNGEDVKVYLKKNGEKVATLAVVSASTAKTMLVELNGEIDLATVSDLNKAVNLKGLESLYKINGQTELTAFWQENFNWGQDQATAQQKYFLELNDKLSQLDKEKMEEMMQKNRQMFEKQKELAQKSKEMAEKYGRMPIFLSAPGDTNMVYILDGKKVGAEEIKKIDPQRIESISVNKPDKDHPGKKGEIRIKTRN